MQGNTASIIKAIETVYHGYRFRSRLEARWAVYFDALELKFEYEPEGFELLGGTRYLPDFYLPELDTYVEVKPNQDLSRPEFEKLVKFGVDAGRKLLLIVGTPTNENMYVIDRRTSDGWQYLDLELQDGVTHEEQVAVYFESLSDWAHVEFGARPHESYLHLVFRSRPPSLDQRLITAALAAKQARFEHGQSGRLK